MEKFAWRPAAGVRSNNEVYITLRLRISICWALTGPKVPAGLKQDLKKNGYVQGRSNRLAETLAGRSQRGSLSAAKPNDFERKVFIADRDAMVDGSIPVLSFMPMSTWVN